MTLLFDIYPAIGHLNASFALANQWRERQHRVVYCAVEAGHKKRIEDNGFECVMLDYLLDSDKQELRVKGLRFILECVISPGPCPLNAVLVIYPKSFLLKICINSFADL